MEKPKATWYAVRDAGMFRAGRYYRDDQLGVLGRMARKVGILVLADPPAVRLAAPPRPTKKAVRARKGTTPTPDKE